jgi:hypothetical protein
MFGPGHSLQQSLEFVLHVSLLGLKGKARVLPLVWSSSTKHLRNIAPAGMICSWLTMGIAGGVLTWHDQLLHFFNYES